MLVYIDYFSYICGMKRGRPVIHKTKEQKREAKRLYERRYYAKNKKRISQQKSVLMKQHREKSKDGFWYVYCLVNANYYVGYTGSLHYRMIEHRKERNDCKDTSDYIILHKCNTEKEAKEYEKIYHDIGFPGKYGHKKTPHEVGFS